MPRPRLTIGQRRVAITAVGLLLAVGVGAVDYLTAPDMSFSIFYLLPVCLVTWYVGRYAGILTSVWAAATWFAVEVSQIPHAHPAIPYWNAGSRSAVFITVVFLLSELRARKEGLEEAVRAKTASLTAEVAEHRQTSEALRCSQDRLHGLIENLKDRAVYVLDPSGHIASWNEGAQRLTGYAADEIVGEPFTRLWPAQDIVSGKAEQAISAAAASGTFEDEGWRVRKDGSRFWALTVLTALRDGDGSLTGFSNVLHDITNRKRFEEELLEIEERRQRRIGRDLHDALGQDLTGVAFLSKELEERLAAKGLPESVEVERIVGEINQAIDRTRALAKGLCPMELAASGLMMALEELALNVEEVFGVPCRFQCEHPVLIYDDVTALHLYRIAQEAVTNAVKHGRPKHITIGLTGAKEQYIMQVADDGQGFPVGTASSTGMGLQIMRYRARSIGGTFSIQRQPEGGTLVLCSVPAGVVGRRLEHGDAGTEATDEGQD